jgi:hypothetical protein
MPPRLVPNLQRAVRAYLARHFPDNPKPAWEAYFYLELRIAKSFVFKMAN